ncbi:MAG: hypothetical protein JWM47_1023 [Acidimicrobiales bacterium]|nr:hypothetical protein [Acidimicrobiales bacterium]
MGDEPTDGEVTEPANSTVDDWFGQNVARDQEVADAAAAEADSEEEAEGLFESRAEGEDRFREGHQRPADGGDEAAVGRPS